VLGHWWEQVLHNQSALRLKGRLLFQRRVVVASVPYQLHSAVSRHPGAQAQSQAQNQSASQAPTPKTPSTSG
jgi:hypothetical protein